MFDVKVLFCLFYFSSWPLVGAIFRCPHDGHFGDDVDCTKYYHCANDRPAPGFCPSGLFWNKATDQCDWPEVTDCTLTVEKARKLQQSNPTTVYLTFDDGPNEGTKAVLDALKAHGVKATFFVNADNLEVTNKRNASVVAENANNLVRIVDEGHMIADHSYDHMRHNNGGVGPRDAYKDVENDLSYFGPRNSLPVVDILTRAGFDKATIEHSAYTIDYFARMPYSNNWRVNPREGRAIVANCPGCTIPARSGNQAMTIANTLNEKWGVQVFGWDMEWNMNWTSNRNKYGGSALFMRVGGAGTHSKRRGRVVVLSHDIAFRPHEITGTYRDQEELEEFLKLATEAGYKFETIMTYFD